LKASNVKKAIHAAFATVCEAVLSACKDNNWSDGACIVATLFVNDVVFVINLGDAKVQCCVSAVEFW
jgi:hypothetical protein